MASLLPTVQPSARVSTGPPTVWPTGQKCAPLSRLVGKLCVTIDNRQGKYINTIGIIGGVQTGPGSGTWYTLAVISPVRRV